MKKVMLIGLLILAHTTSTFAQDSKLSIQKITCGAILTVGTTASFPLQEKPFSTWYGLSPAINIITKKTHHHIMYGTGDNSIQTLNGYFLPKSCDVYMLFSQNLNNFKQEYLSVGIEKVVPAGDHAIFVFFGEVGTNLQGKQSMSFGLIIHPQIKLWKRG